MDIFTVALLDCSLFRDHCPKRNRDTSVQVYIFWLRAESYEVTDTKPYQLTAAMFRQMQNDPPYFPTYIKRLTWKA